MSLDLSIPGDWRSWDDASKDRLIARLKAETLLQGKIATYCEDETPSAMAKRWMGDRWKHRAYHDVLDQLALDLEDGTVDRATISMPPQVGKAPGSTGWCPGRWPVTHSTPSSACRTRPSSPPRTPGRYRAS